VFPYTLYFALDPGGILGGLPGFIPGVLGVGALLAAGFRPVDCYLRAAPISRGGFFVLVAVTFLLVPILSAGQWVGWSPLPALLTTFKGRILLALAAHSALFALWHLQMLVQMPLPVALVAFMVLPGWVGAGRPNETRRWYGLWPSTACS
jgi:hypothetical protein